MVCNNGPNRCIRRTDYSRNSVYIYIRIRLWTRTMHLFNQWSITEGRGNLPPTSSLAIFFYFYFFFVLFKLFKKKCNCKFVFVGLTNILDGMRGLKVRNDCVKNHSIGLAMNAIKHVANITSDGSVSGIENGYCFYH